MMELKFEATGSPEDAELCFNRTMMELKFSQRDWQAMRTGRFNRTMMELKSQNDAFRHVDINALIEP